MHRCAALLQLLLGLRSTAPSKLHRYNDFHSEGNAFFKAGQLEQAIAAYTAAVEADPSMHTAYSNRRYVTRLVGREAAACVLMRVAAWTQFHMPVHGRSLLFSAWYISSLASLKRQLLMANAA